ncbi:hypothetical protein [Sphingomonas baiyangensis]|uniref:Uncharacterized protein n=1 Tax=Sphingomonas baiyangensis TaxID=2572576 RepID=A0A4U1L277_9SPHN|nr:hypothetical protein [Sphingomonas baiyangensis]TKD50584.1 hypothetical protein FBR43_07245 [Sphingomonas baiyangensis]
MMIGTRFAQSQRQQAPQEQDRWWEKYEAVDEASADRAAPPQQRSIPPVIHGPPPSPPPPPSPLEQGRFDIAVRGEQRADEADARAAQSHLLQMQKMQQDMEQAETGRQSPANIDALSEQISRVRQLYNQSLRGKGVGSIMEYLPTGENRAFDSAAAGLADQALAAFRVPGVGAQSDRELQAFVMANQPRAGDFDEAIEEKLLNLQRRVDARRGELGLPGWNYEAGAPIAAAPAAPAAPGGSQPAAPESPDVAQPRGAVRFNDEMPDVSAQATRLTPEQQRAFQALAQSGASEATLMAFAQDAGLGSDPSNVKAIVEFYAKPENRNSPLGVDYSEIDRLRPVDAGDGAAGAAARGALDSLTLGFSDEIGAGVDTAFKGGSYAENVDRRRGMAAFDEQDSPLARMGGQFAGGLAMPMGGARTAAQVGKAGAAYGAAYGAGSADNGDRLLGAVGGGALGGAAGYGLTRAAAGIGTKHAARAAERQQRDALLAASQRQRVPLTIPDIAPGARGTFAGAEAIPGGGMMANRAMNRGDQAIEKRVAEIGGGGNVLDRQVLGETLRSAGKGYVDRSGDIGRRAYRLAEQRAGGQQITPTEMLRSIDEQLADLGRSPEVNRETIDLLNRYRSDLVDPTGAPKALDLDVIRQQRTNLRGKTNVDGLRGTDAERRMGMALDAASNDIAAQLPAGAKAAYDRADRLWKGRSDTIDRVISEFIGQKDGQFSAEQVAGNLTNMTSPRRGNAAALRSMMEKLDPQQRADVATTIAAQLGRRGDDGENAFSPAKFFTDLQRYSPQARQAIWGKDGARDLSDLAKIAEQKSATRGRLNNSSSGRTVNFRNAMQVLLGGGAAVSAGAGSTLGVGLAAATTGSAMATAAILGSPKAVRALAYIGRATSLEKQSRGMRMLAAVAAQEPALAQDIVPIREMLEQEWAKDARTRPSSPR